MKALSTTILIVISAVVILIAALIVLTIFGGGMQNVVTLTQAKNLCLASAQSSCTATGNLPATWYIPTMNVQDDQGRITQKSCHDIKGLENCVCDKDTRKLECD